MDKWECHDLGEVKEFLCMHIVHSGRDIHLDQINYLKKVLVRFGFENAKSHPTPLPTGWSPTENTGKATKEEISEYQCLIGSLLYLMIGTRPDISFAVTSLSWFAANPSSDHIERAKYVLHYLVGTQNHLLKYLHKSSGLGTYMDSDWAADKIMCRSVTGFFFVMVADD